MATEIFHPLVLSLDPAGGRSAAPGRPDIPAIPRGGRHGFLDLDRWERAGGVADRGRAAATLLDRLRQAAERREPVAVGILADPYGSRRAARTRATLESCLSLQGLALSLTTRSPWVLRDLDLLAELDACHAVSIEVPITAADPEIARRLEPDAAEPAERLAAVAALAAQGLSTTVWCLPIVPEVNGREEVLRDLFAAAREAGARDVAGSPLFRAPALTAPGARFLPRRAREIAVRRAGRDRGDADALRLATLFARLRLEHGFPRDLPGRG
jgi:DNA repair photolyase